MKRTSLALSLLLLFAGCSKKGSWNCSEVTIQENFYSARFVVIDFDERILTNNTKSSFDLLDFPDKDFEIKSYEDFYNLKYESWDDPRYSLIEFISDDELYVRYRRFYDNGSSSNRRINKDSPNAKSGSDGQERCWLN